MELFKRLNSKKILRAAHVAFFVFVVSSFAIALISRAALSINERVLNESNAASLKGAANLGSTVCLPPIQTVTSTTKPKCDNSINNQVGATGIFDNLAACIGGYVYGRDPSCSDVSVSQGPNGQTLYTYNTTVGAQEALANYTARMIKEPPISSTEYIAYVAESFRHPFAPPAYAQGLGFSSLSPVLELWRAMRNLAYFFFVVIFIIIGFMIMFRSKIGGKAAVTVQQALPKIVVSLLLVTFSYAIAGLMIDVMYILIYLMIGIFARESITGLRYADLSALAFEGNIFSNAFRLFSDNIIGSVAGALGNIAVSTLGLDESPLGGLVQGASNIVFTLVVGIALLVSVFRIFFALLKAYIGIFFSVIFAPIQLLIGALPGQDTFGSWLKGLFENLLVFPILTLLIILAHFFVKSSFGPDKQDQLGFSPPQLTSNQGATGFQVFSGLIPLGIILAMPEVLKLAQGAMKGQIGVSFEDLQKNFNAGRKGASRALWAPADAAVGAGIGFYAGKKLGKTNRAGALGALVGGLGGVATGMPHRTITNMGRATAGVIAESSIRLGMRNVEEKVAGVQIARDQKTEGRTTDAGGTAPRKEALQTPQKPSGKKIV